MKAFFPAMLLLAFLFAACAPNDAPAPTEIIYPVTAVLQPPTTTPKITPSVTPGSLIYQVVYISKDFQIREANLGVIHSWDQHDFVMPAARIAFPRQELGLGINLSREQDELHYQQIKKNGWAIFNATLTTGSGLRNTYTLMTNSLAMGGHYILQKNGRELWEGDLAGTTTEPIRSSKRIGDEIAIEYYSVLSIRGNVKESILLTDRDTVVDLLDTTPQYDAVYAPNAVNGKLVYFAKKYGPLHNNEIGIKYFLVVGGTQVVQYDNIFNQFCCWDGPPIQIFGNGKIIDFFAQKGNAWYHVQAGDLSRLSPP